MLGWYPKVSLEAGLQSTYEWMQTHLGFYRPSTNAAEPFLTAPDDGIPLCVPHLAGNEREYVDILPGHGLGLFGREVR